MFQRQLSGGKRGRPLLSYGKIKEDIEDLKSDT